MKGAVLAIGDELTSGYRLDTNSQAISRRLASVPVEVILHLAVGDDMEMIQRWLRAALMAADVVIITGGLGPTEDDLTRQAVAACFGLPLVENGEALAQLQQRFALRQRPMPLSNLIQAQVPAGSEIMLNDRGTAAGFYLPTNGHHIFVTPGIPYEMEGMLEGFILPRLRELVGPGRHVHRAALKVYGLPESAINERIRSMMARDRNPLLGLLPHRGTITIEVVATAPTAMEAEVLASADLSALHASLGQYVISDDERELPHVVAAMLLQRRWTLAVSEVGTGGLLAARLTEPEGAAGWLCSSVVYSSETEESAMIAGALPATCGDAALAMAHAAREREGADIGLAVGPVILPRVANSASTYGSVFVAAAAQARDTCREITFNGDRLRVREWAADAALSMLRQWMLQGEAGSDDLRRTGESASS